MSDFKLKTWDPGFHNDKKTPFSMLAIGPSRSGKTFMLRMLFMTQWRKRFDLIMLISATEEYSHGFSFLKTIGERVLVKSKYNPADIEKLIEMQKTSHGRVLILFDDLVDKNVKTCATLDKLWTMGRHFGISIIYSIQKTSFLSTAARGNANITVLFPSRGQEKAFVHETLVGPSVEENDYKAKLNHKKTTTALISDAWAVKYQALVLDDRNPAVLTCDRVFKFKV